MVGCLRLNGEPALVDDITFNLYATCDPLPVVLSNFSAQSINCQAELKWHTEDGFNFSHFMVERSIDGRRFTAIGQEPASDPVADYVLLDDLLSGSIHYYRLKMVDHDGTYDYSNVISVRPDCGSDIKAFPSLTSGRVELTGLEPGMLITFYDVHGQLHLSQESAAGTEYLNLDAFPQGVYFLRVYNGTASFFVTKIIKQ